MGDSFVGRGAPLPPTPDERLYPIWWVKPGDSAWDLTVLDESWDAYDVHWVPAEKAGGQGRHRLCLASVEQCPYCALPVKWVGYLAVYNHRERCKGGLVVTTHLARDLQQLAPSRTGLFCLRISVWSLAKASGGGTHARISDSPRAFTDPPRISLQPTLQRLYGLDRWPNQILIPSGKADTIPFPIAGEDRGSDRYGLGGAKGGVR